MTRQGELGRDFKLVAGIGQIRLAELSVYNWGSFAGLHTARIYPQGTLITGDNGAGKSTLVDGLMALLLPPGKALFNIAAAQGDRADRSLVSYLRGSYGSAHDGSRTQVLYKRPGPVVSALRAAYRGEDGSIVTLAALFWMTQASSAYADLKRLYLVGRREVTLEELLEPFGEGNVRALKQRLRPDTRVTSFDTFGDYQETYRRQLGLENRNAPALLSRALGLKKIDDLTTLIRELVLEPSTVREEARRAVAEFADLVGIHQELVTARQQGETLDPLPQLQGQLEACIRHSGELEAERRGLPIYFGRQCLGLWDQQVSELTEALERVRLEHARTRRQLEDAATRVERCHADYLQAGGSRMEAVRTELTHARARLEEIGEAAGQYQALARELGLDPELTEVGFEANRRRLDQALAELKVQRTEAEDRFGDQAGRLTQLAQRFEQLRQ
ncbi:MAG: ATP-binding protein [Candidatus Competibacteraceae bacterium]|nr:ATP-binding protein [Candidatus Competibacteraceae bacterium]